MRENTHGKLQASAWYKWYQIAQRITNDSMLPIIQTFLSNFVLAYRKLHSANHVLINVIEIWKKNLHNIKLVDAVSWIY